MAPLYIGKTPGKELESFGIERGSDELTKIVDIPGCVVGVISHCLPPKIANIGSALL